MKPVSKPASFNQCPFRCISGGGAVLLSLLHIIKKIVHTRGFRPREWRYLWNTQNQLTACFTPKGDCWHYTYDAFGRRLSKTKTVDSDLAHIDPLFPQIKPKITTWRYLWSGDQLIEETPIYADGTLAASQQIQWLYQPGEITPTERYQQGKLHYVVTDHQGTSREIFSEGGQASWTGRLNTWGQMQFWRYREGKAENDPNYTECPFRFAGQYEDEESGLYYNRFRYYDKETGQYLSPDPIGLLGGLNPYGYVHCPTGWVDPFGLAGGKGNKGEPVKPKTPEVVELDPKTIRFSQTSVNDTAEITQSMKAKGWDGDPIDVIRMKDGGLTTIDNTRVLAASRAGINVKARVHDGSTPIPQEFIRRFTTSKGVPSTWEEAINLRIGKQNAGSRKRYPNGSTVIGSSD